MSTTLLETLREVGFSPEVEAEVKTKIPNYFEQFLALVAREVANLSLEKRSLHSFNDSGKQMLMDHMGMGILDAFTDNPKKWLSPPVAA